MSYTATTIGFGEIPYPFTYNQRMWVTISIYLTVIGWAYAIGSLLALLQDRSFRSALALQRFTRKVARLGEPFVLVAGYGRAGELLGHSMDAAGPPLRRPRHVRRADRRSGARELPRRRPRAGRRRARPRPPRRRGPRPRLVRGGRRADRRRRGEPVRRHVGRAAAPRRPGDRACHLPGDGRPDARLRHAQRGQSVRRLRRPPPARTADAGRLPAAHLAGERTGGRPARPAGCRPAAAAGSSAGTAGSAGS